MLSFFKKKYRYGMLYQVDAVKGRKGTMLYVFNRGYNELERKFVIDVETFDSELVNVLNILGNQGWEVIQVSDEVIYFRKVVRK